MGHFFCLWLVMWSNSKCRNSNSQKSAEIKRKPTVFSRKQRVLWSCYPDLNWRPHPYQLIARPRNASIRRFGDIFVPKNRKQWCFPLNCLRPLVSYCGSGCGSSGCCSSHIRKGKPKSNRPLPLAGDPSNLLNEAPLFFICADPPRSILPTHLKAALKICIAVNKYSSTTLYRTVSQSQRKPGPADFPCCAPPLPDLSGWRQDDLKQLCTCTVELIHLYVFPFRAAVITDIEDTLCTNGGEDVLSRFLSS